MAQYEAMIIIRPELSEADAAKAVTRLEEAVVKQGGKVEKSQLWGRRRLAFPIAKQREGLYHLLQFQADTQAITELKQQWRLDEAIVRAMILRANGGGG